MLQSWITANDVFSERDQGQIPETLVNFDDGDLIAEGQVTTPL